MNPVNNPKKSKKSPKSAPETVPQSPLVAASNDAEITPELAVSTDTGLENLTTPARQHPIPPPSEPMQYRAIGLIRGQYMPSVEQVTRGTLLAADHTLIDAVLLGRVMSLIKNHISLDQHHLWVVYPRSRQEDGYLHVQILGVWEPEKLHQPPYSTGEKSVTASESTGQLIVTDDYFSIRGEVIYQGPEQEEIVVKIRQAPRKKDETSKFFKLKLKGVIPAKAIGHFYDFQILRQGNSLVIQQMQDIGRLPPRKEPGKKPFRGGGYSTNRKYGDFAPPTRTGDKPTPPKRREPLPKPIKRQEISS